MATLVLTTVGTALGGPIGGALGSLVGGSIDQGLTGRRRKGPRLGDLSVQTSSYGSPIPRIYGTMRVAGTVIWATDLKEEEVIEGGGKGSPERTTYSYSVNLAVALSSRQIRSVGRIWADGKLIRGAAGDFKVKTGFRLLTGGQDQEIDPLIASVETIDQTPAYRGLALAVFEDFELAEFGNRIPMLTFEVVADEGLVPLGTLVADASGNAIEADEPRPIAGFAALGSSIRDALETLVELSGLRLVDRDGRLRTPQPGEPLAISKEELGCDAERAGTVEVERSRAPESAMPTSLTMTYYDRDRDYQAGQARASSGQAGLRAEQVELAAVLTASEARQLAESAIARRWRTSDRLKLRLPPSRMGLRAGDTIRLAGDTNAVSIAAISIEGMAVVIEAEHAGAAIQALPADGGRPISEPDLRIGRSELIMFETPTDGPEPAAAPRVWLAASNEGRWKRVLVELNLGATPMPGVLLGRRAMVGHAETALDGRAPLILDELSTVTVRLANGDQILTNADWDALASGANLAVLGEELIQFGRAQQLDVGLFSLSKLLRGRRGTEWAANSHSAAEQFCLIDPAAAAAVDLPVGAVGATLTATAHGIGDVAPLPQAARFIGGEAMRPPAPCRLQVGRTGTGLAVRWVRRSHRNWAWIDGLGDGVDGFPEKYRVTLSGPGGETTVETDSSFLMLDAAQIPGEAGQPVQLSVATIGAAAVSRPVSTAFIL